MNPPLVSAILPIADPRRVSLARKAVNNFIRQHYTPYELIVVNGTGIDVLTNQEMDTDAFRSAGCSVQELRVPAGLNAAAMRNRGIQAAAGDWLFPIDDDDWCHPQRLLFQMAHRRGNRACLLRNQLRVDVSKSLTQSVEDHPVGSWKPLLHLVTRNNGIDSTILFPRQNIHYAYSEAQLWLYDETLNTGEHEELLARIQQNAGDPVVCNNSHNRLVQGMQWPILSIAVYHGGNELLYEQFFGGTDVTRNSGNVPTGLVDSDIQQLKVVLQSYNFDVR